MDRFLVRVDRWVFLCPTPEDWFATTEDIGAATDFGESAYEAAEAIGGRVIRLPAEQVPDADAEGGT